MPPPSRVPLDEIRLRLVTSADDIAALRAWAPAGVVACDIETTGLQPYGLNADKIRLVQFGDENEGWAVPFIPGAHVALVCDTLARFEGKLVGHNSRFDRAFLKAAAIPLGVAWDDSYILHHLLYPLDYHGLKSVAGQFYGQAARAGEKWLDNVKRKNRWDWATVPIEHPAYWGYAAMDCCLTARVWNDMATRLGEAEVQYQRELRVASMMADVSAKGMPVDLEYAEGLLGKWSTEAAEIKDRLAAFEIEKPGSGAQIAAALANDGWEPDLLTERGKPSVNRAVLEGLDHEVARLVLRWRRLTKWGKSYVEPMIASGGQLHCNISSLRAATGRMAIDSPPLQQLPRGPEVRSCLLADEGTELWAIDWVGQEARLLAAYVGDPEFTKEVIEGGDLHSNIARTLYGDDFTREQRGWCKNAFYAYCPTADARVMLDDLSWKPAGKLEVGDKIRAFDEHLLGDPGGHPRARARRWAPAVIESVSTVTVPIVEVELDTGEVLRTSLDHQWLVSDSRDNAAKWVKAEDIKPGWTMRQYAVPADRDETHEAGWLAGIFDGEGHLGFTSPTSFRAGVSQNEGPVAERIRAGLRFYGMKWTEEKPRDCVRFTLKTTLPEMYEFLAKIRPERLIAKVPYGNGLFSARRHKVVAVRFPAQHEEVIVTRTSTSTMVIEGYGGHNCYGAAAARLAETAHAPRGRFEKAVKAAYPAIAGFMEDVIATGKARVEKDGMAWAKTMGGRTVAVPKSRIYALTNYIMQGGGADLMKQAIERVDDAGLAHTIRLVVHDELVCAFPIGEGERLASIVQGCLATEFRGVPFTASVKGPGKSWGDVA